MRQLRKIDRSTTKNTIVSLVAMLFLLLLVRQPTIAQTTRVAGAGHVGFAWTSTGAKTSGALPLGLEIGELGFDVELIPRKLFTYGSLYFSSPNSSRDQLRAGFEAGAGFLPIRKSELYLTGGFLVTEGGLTPTLGIGTHMKVSDRGNLRFRASLFGLTSFSIGYVYTVYRDDSFKEREIREQLRVPATPPAVIGRASSSYFRRGSDYDLQFVLENLSDQSQSDILFDIKVIGPANSVEEYRPVVVSDVVGPKKKISTEDITVFGVSKQAQNFEATSLGPLQFITEEQFAALELLPVSDGEIELSLVNFGYDTEKRDAEFKSSIKNTTSTPLDCIIFKAELLDKNKSVLSTRYFSATEEFPAGSVTESQLYTMYNVGQGVAWMRCTALRKHVKRARDW